MDSICKLGIYSIVSLGIISLSHGCVNEYKEGLKECMDPLKAAITGSVDINEVFCRPDHRAGLNCVIKFLKNCTQLLEEPFVASFQKDDFTAEDLTQVTSAENFCACAPTLQCLQQITFKNGFMASQGTSPWKQIDAPYVCGSKKTSIECVARSLPGCKMYLQHKRQDFSDDDALAVQKMPDFIQNHCSKVDENYASFMKCTREKSQIHTLPDCAHETKLRPDMEKRVCGQLDCILREFEPCSMDSVKLYIETINVYQNETIPLTKCSASGAVGSMFSLVAIILSLLITLHF